MKETLKRVVGPAWQSRIHRASRLRWITKSRLLRELHTEAGLATRVRYVLFDPETESWSFDLDNEREVIHALGQALGREDEEIAAYAAEPRTDPELCERFMRHVRWRFDVKHRVPLGPRLIWYVVVRALKPELVVETGIYMGFGSLVLLRALERNRSEGQPGELISCDADPHAGNLVRAELRGAWHRITGFSQDVLLPALEGRQVGVLVQDTPHTEANQRFEFGAALSHAAPTLVLIEGSGWAPTLEIMCREAGGSYRPVMLRPCNHIVPGYELGLGIFDQNATTH